MKNCKEEGCKNPRAGGRSRCFSCYGKSRRREQKIVVPKARDGKLRILMLDIETTPNLVWTWSIWNANIGINQIVEPTKMLCFAAQWYGSDQMEFYSQWEDGQSAMVAAAWQLLDEADIVIHFYGSRFDVPHLNREFLEEGLLPPSPFKQIDLKFAVSKRFKFTSNKLQFVSEVLGLEGKEEHEGFGLWSKVMAGDVDAQARMESYNKRDVELLGEVYEVLLPWIPGHPHRGLYNGLGGCPTCGVEDELEDAGFAYTRMSKFKQYLCTSCGSYFRDSRRLNGATLQESVL